MGEVEVPTELEKIMLIESEEIIRSRYDDLQGSKEIALLINKKNKKLTLLQQTGIENKIKLKEMKKTWEYTRTYSMFFRYIELLFYIIIS
jgi:tRNA G10  N-methylase Trm11